MQWKRTGFTLLCFYKFRKGAVGRKSNNIMLNRFLALCAFVLLVVSCGTVAMAPGKKVINSATYTKGGAKLYVNPLQADLQVSSKKINYNMPVSEAVSLGGLDNVISTAVKEALDANGGDVIVGLETSVSYKPNGTIESISITGYPATYTNFRNIEVPPTEEPEAEKKEGGLLSGFKLKK